MRSRTARICDQTLSPERLTTAMRRLPVLVRLDVCAWHVEQAVRAEIARDLEADTLVTSNLVAFFAEVQIGKWVEREARRGLGRSGGRVVGLEMRAVIQDRHRELQGEFGIPIDATVTSVFPRWFT